jgi:hypothetical protein
MMRTLVSVCCSAALLLAWAGAALAQSSERTGYGGPGGVQGEVEGGGALPFTGLDLGLLIGGGLLLVAVGATLRRVSRARS